MKITRRKLIRYSAVAACAGLGLGGYAWQIEPRWVAYEEKRLPINKLPTSLIGKTLVQLSDLHIGTKVSDSYLRNQFEHVASLSPDFVVYTGDFLDSSSDYHIGKLKSLLPHLPKGSVGTAGVLGNHDYNLREHDVTKAMEAAGNLKDAGIAVLFDEFVEFGGLHIAGLEDFWSPRFRQERSREVIQSLPPSSITLSHNPDTADLPIWEGFASWILCGHTHGGQCRVPGFRPPILPVRNKNYVAGNYSLGGGRKMYINRGLGHTMKVRFCVRPEITRFTLATGESLSSHSK